MEQNWTDLADYDYILTDGSAWFTVGGFAIRICKTDDGVICKIYQDQAEMDDPLATCEALDAELTSKVE